MNVASLELCKELYELSGWHDTNGYLYEDSSNKENVHFEFSKWGKWWYEGINAIPAYDLGYLLRKLPHEATSKKHGGYHYLYMHHGKPYWYAYYGPIDTTELMATANTPEDTSAKLCIELFKAKILSPQVREEK